jgi:hypothetical protein
MAARALGRGVHATATTAGWRAQDSGEREEALAAKATITAPTAQMIVFM